MNYRKDILEKVNYIMKKEPGIKINYARLAREYNCDYRTVKKHVEAVKAGNVSPPERKYPKKTEGFEEIIREKLKTGAPAIAIYNYLVKYNGYQGSYSTITALIRQIHHINQKNATIRFETSPGIQAQVDWKESLKLETKTGQTIKFNIFLLILGYSRTKFLMATETRDLQQVEKCLAEAFRYIGGVPHEILFDNMRSVIDKARTQYSEPVFNENFKHFAGECGFRPLACVSYRPETKGKVEVTAKLMNRLKVFSGEIESFSDIGNLVKEFNSEINNEVCQGTGFRPVERLKLEQGCLIKINPEILNGYFDKPIKRKVSKESLVTYEGNRYSVPTGYIGKEVNIRVKGETISILYEDIVIRQWKKSSKLYNYDSADYREILANGSLRDLEQDEIEHIAERNLRIYDEL